MNTHREHELELAANWAKPENQAELVPGPDPDKIKNFKIFFQKIKPKPLLVQHVKGQPAASTYIREKGGVTCYTNRGTPCSTDRARYGLTSVILECQVVRGFLLLLLDIKSLCHNSTKSPGSRNNRFGRNN